MSTATDKAIPTWGEVKNMNTSESVEVMSPLINFVCDDIVQTFLPSKTYIAKKYLDENKSVYNLLNISLIFRQSLGSNKFNEFYLGGTSIPISITAPKDGEVTQTVSSVSKLFLLNSGLCICTISNGDDITAHVKISAGITINSPGIVMSVGFEIPDDIEIYFNDSSYIDSSYNGWLVAKLILI